MFLKRIGRMEAEEDGRQKRETMLLKKKRSWDENKNVQLAVPLQ
jgi:hypothetical protein